MEENSAPVDMVNLYVNIKYPIIFRVLYMPGGCFGISSINSMMCSNSLRMNRKFTLKFHPLGLLKFRLVIFWEGKFGGDEGLVMEKHLKKRYSCCEGHFPHFKVLQAGEIQDFTKVILSVIWMVSEYPFRDMCDWCHLSQTPQVMSNDRGFNGAAHLSGKDHWRLGERFRVCWEFVWYCWWKKSQTTTWDG